MRFSLAVKALAAAAAAEGCGAGCPARRRLPVRPSAPHLSTMQTIVHVANMDCPPT